MAVAGVFDRRLKMACWWYKDGRFGAGWWGGCVERVKLAAGSWCAKRTLRQKKDRIPIQTHTKVILMLYFSCLKTIMWLVLIYNHQRYNYERFK